MSQWRVILTDSEGPTGVAPVCPKPDVHAMMHGGSPDDLQIYDECCAGPHIECWTPSNAEDVRVRLDRADAEVCS